MATLQPVPTWQPIHITPMKPIGTLQILHTITNSILKNTERTTSIPVPTLQPVLTWQPIHTTPKKLIGTLQILHDYLKKKSLLGHFVTELASILQGTPAP